MGKNVTGYELSKQWFEFAMGNTDIVNPVHGILYLWIVELNNKLGWRDKFDLPTSYSMQAIGIKNWRTYKKAFDDLIKWGFIEVISKSTNQHTANVVAIVKNTIASHKHIQKQVSSTAHEIKQEETIQTIQTIQTFLNENVNYFFNEFLKIQKNPVTELRVKILAENLEKLSPTNDDLKIEIIKQAISGGYSDFRPLTMNKQKGATDFEIASVLAKHFAVDYHEGLKPPSIQEFEKYFEESGYKQAAAQKAYDALCYNKKWKDRNGNCVIAVWKEIVSKQYFKDENKNTDNRSF